MSQLHFPEVERAACSSWLLVAPQFLRAQRATYRRMARVIEPDRTNWRDVWDRVAFAILTANATYEASAQALARVRQDRRHPSDVRFGGIQGMTPEKLDYLDSLPYGEHVFALLRGADEPWHEYRLRLMHQVQGLALTKASFAACMLYPLDADVACLDTWIQKIFTWTPRFRSLPLSRYIEVEGEVRALAAPAKVSTALCQWMLWDLVRGTTTDQRVFD